MKVTEIGGILDKQTSLIKEVKNWLALLALIILAAEVILIIALITTPANSSIYKWYVPFMLFFLFIIVIGFFYDRYLTAQSNDFYKLKKIEKKIVGTWWEFMLNHKTISLSIVELTFDSNQLQFVLKGTAYSQDAHILASWKSDACAVTNLTSPELHYFWEGDHFDKNQIEGKFSGVGVIQFPDINSANEVKSAEGWFTSGNISELKFTGKHKTEFIKCTTEETDKLKNGIAEKQAFLIERHKQWKDKFD
jgi:hypothetical protein